MENLSRYFYECPECGYLTEIISGNQAWCPNCTKRFPIYFKKWSLDHGGAGLDLFRQQHCVSYTDKEVGEVVSNVNAEKYLTEPTKEQIIRRSYIEAGVSLDRGGYYEWDGKSILKYLIGIAILAGIVLIVSIVAWLFGGLL